MDSRARSFIVSVAACALAATIGIPFAFASSPAEPQAAAEEQPPVAVEDFNYPGADRILKEKGIKLKRGDGHVVLADCDQTADQIRVMTVEDPAAGRAGTYCFRATTKTGYLTLELPRVFYFETGTHPISADLTANGATTTVDVAKGGWKSVGEGLPGGAQSVLVEIRVTG
ncbi:hypothetical protein ACFQVC_21505 [Streptomyces monticola]|uniref:Secreted protein n=1 Tax=Streptomyces monticola TaxID=2666263 RepID=A0ABW2JKY9_9ACTN